jgi:V8-like Glu-specific endopeptidase
MNQIMQTQLSADPVQPDVYKSVRAVGTFKPKFNPRDGKVFSDELNVVGTAFWLKEYKVLVTCAHVVQNLLGAPLEIAGLLVVGEAGNYRRAVVDNIDLKHDLAVLRLINNDNTPLSGEELEKESEKGLVLANSYNAVGTSVAYAGFPLGNQLLNELHSPTYAEGVIGVARRENDLRKEIQISGPVAGGFSGSPVVLKDDTAQLVGIVSNGPKASGSIFMAISWEHVKAIAELANS